MNSKKDIDKLPMIGLDIATIVDIVKGQYVGDDEKLSAKITGISSDSRKLTEGNLYAAIAGTRVDGHDYADDAIKNGAIASIVEKNLDNPDITQIIVESTETALQQIATYYREILSIPIVAVIGSVGKTSTKETITRVLEQKYNVCHTEGNLNNELGLPLSIFKIKKIHEVAVLEMGINHFGEMTILAKIAKPDITVFTNVADCHLEYLHDKQGVYKAKSEAFEHMHDKNSIGILNGDDEILGNVKEINNKKPITFGLKKTNYCHFSDYEMLGLNGSRGNLNIGKTSFDVELPLPGTHAIYNMLAAACVASKLDMSNEEIAQGISNAKALSGHGNIINTSKFTILNESYNANPDSMRAAIDLLQYSSTRKVAILGDMAELGQNEKQLHYQLGQYLSTKNIDVLITIGDLSKNIAKGYEESIAEAKKNNVEIHTYGCLDSFLKDLSTLLNNGDSILVKASNFMHFDKVVKSLQDL